MVVPLWQVIFSKQALKDIEKLEQSNLDKKARALVAIIKTNPFQNPPPYKKLKQNLSGLYSRRINHQHRFVYEISGQKKAVRIIRMWTHFT